MKFSALVAPVHQYLASGELSISGIITFISIFIIIAQGSNSSVAFLV